MQSGQFIMSRQAKGFQPRIGNLRVGVAERDEQSGYDRGDRGKACGSHDKTPAICVLIFAVIAATERHRDHPFMRKLAEGGPGCHADKREQQQAQPECSI